MGENVRQCCFLPNWRDPVGTTAGAQSWAAGSCWIYGLGGKFNGYRKIAAVLRAMAGWVVNDKRVERIWRREGAKVPAKQPKRAHLRLNDSSCVLLRA